jgi:anti-sigma regulatory factor (Ser/Thr protein kinase)
MTAHGARWLTGDSVDDAPEWLSAISQGIAAGERRPPAIHLAPQTRSLAFEATPESVREARDFARSVLASWDLGEMFDDVRLVISELVTNALRYAPAAPDGTLPIRLTLLRTGARLTCAVTDPSDQIPVTRDPDFTSQNGRGLCLVEAFSDSWNWAPLEGQGKVVWACFQCPSA